MKQCATGLSVYKIKQIVLGGWGSLNPIHHPLRTRLLIDENGEAN